MQFLADNDFVSCQLTKDDSCRMFGSHASDVFLIPGV